MPFDVNKKRIKDDNPARQKPQENEKGMQKVQTGYKKALKKTVKEENNSRSSDTKAARKDFKDAKKAVKKAGANTPTFKKIMKGKFDVK